MLKVKICGLRRVEDAKWANGLSPDYVGFVFAQSKRRVTVSEALAISNALYDNILRVGVFVNPTKSEIDEVLKSVRLDIIQLHGNETPSFCESLRLPVWKAFRIKSHESFKLIKEYEGIVDAVVLDGFNEGSYGGTGMPFAWHLAAKKDFSIPVVLAGGLNHMNVEEACGIVKPDIVDVSGGVETEGFKDPAKVAEFIRKAKRPLIEDTSKTVYMQSSVVSPCRYKTQDETFRFGGQFVPESLMSALYELEKTYKEVMNDRTFLKQYKEILNDYSGRPTPLYCAENLSRRNGLGKLYLKREDLNHTGAHKINNVIGQALLAKKMGKKRLIAETGAGQHGVATATAAALFNLECEIFMGEEDASRQELNLFRMKVLGAKVRIVTSGTRTLKDATNEALRDWAASFEHTHYLIGSVVGPHPFPEMVRNFQRIIGDEAREQILEKEGRLPDYLVACVGGGSNAMGLFYPFLNDMDVKIVGVEAAGEGIDTNRHAASLTAGSVGILHGMKSYFLQNEYGQINPAHSISAGLDYPGVGPEHASLKDSGRARYVAVTDKEALEAFYALAEEEGIIPALESAHAIAYALKMPLGQNQITIVNLSGRGDKDLGIVRKESGRDEK